MCLSSKPALTWGMLGASAQLRYLTEHELPRTFRFLSIQHRSDAIRASLAISERHSTTASELLCGIRFRGRPRLQGTL